MITHCCTTHCVIYFDSLNALMGSADHRDSYVMETMIAVI